MKREEVSGLMKKEAIEKEITTKYMTFNTLLMAYFKEIMNQGYPNKGQAKILSILKEQPVLSQKDLIAQLEMTPQSASELIKKLENKQLIVKEKSQEDKRISIIQLTSAGMQEAEKNYQFQPIALNSLTEDEKMQFNTILDKLIVEITPKITKE